MEGAHPAGRRLVPNTSGRLGAQGSTPYPSAIWSRRPGGPGAGLERRSSRRDASSTLGCSATLQERTAGEAPTAACRSMGQQVTALREAAARMVSRSGRQSRGPVPAHGTTAPAC